MSRRRQLTRQAFSVSAAFLVASGLGFVLLGLVARWLPPDENARFLAVWALVFFFGSALSTVEQTASRRSAHAAMESRATPLGVLQSAGLAWLLSLLALGVLLLTPSGGALLGSVWVALLALVALVGFTGEFVVRGIFLGTGEVGRFLTVLLVEAGSRAALVAGLVLAGVTGSVELAVAAVVVGCYSWLPFVRRAGLRIAWHEERDRWRDALSIVAALGAVNALTALMVTGYPAMVGVVVGDVSGLAHLFGVLTLSRVPLVLLAPLTTMAVPLVTRLVVAGQAVRLRGLLVVLTAGGAVAAVVLGAAGYVVGPWAMRVFMGAAYDPPGLLVAVVLAGTCVLGAALIQTAALIALGELWRLAALWFVGDLVAVLAILVLPGTTEVAAVSGFVAAGLVIQLGGAVVVWRSVGRTHILQR